MGGSLRCFEIRLRCFEIEFQVNAILRNFKNLRPYKTALRFWRNFKGAFVKTIVAKVSDTSQEKSFNG
jgi:hypothetical protein